MCGLHSLSATLKLVKNFKIFSNLGRRNKRNLYPKSKKIFVLWNLIFALSVFKDDHNEDFVFNSIISVL